MSSRSLRMVLVLIALWAVLAVHPETRDAFLTAGNITPVAPQRRFVGGGLERTASVIACISDGGSRAALTAGVGVVVEARTSAVGGREVLAGCGRAGSARTGDAGVFERTLGSGVGYGSGSGSATAPLVVAVGAAIASTSAGGGVTVIAGGGSEGRLPASCEI